MAKLKSNPYVYPYVPFKWLSCGERAGAKGDYMVKKRKISWSGIEKIIAHLQREPIAPRGRNVAEKIFSIFLDKNVLFGPREFILDNKIFWLDKIQYFTDKKQKIKFTLLGFPFKIPVPLKTSRTYPDMGEVLILLQLRRIVLAIEKIYSPGAEIVVFTEGGLGRFVGIPPEEAEEYKNFLVRLNKRLGFSRSLVIRELADMEKDRNFKRLFRNNLAQLKNKFNNNDRATRKKYAGAEKSIAKIINTRKFNEQVLADVYNAKISDAKAGRKVMQVRNYIRKKLPAAILGYFAYLQTRDDLKYLEKEIPRYLALSVSPKPGRLGIIPVNAQCDKLPYHAVPIFNAKESRFYLDYLVDMKCGQDKYTAVYLKEDKEQIPFYYILVQ